MSKVNLRKDLVCLRKISVSSLIKENVEERCRGLNHNAIAPWQFPIFSLSESSSYRHGRLQSVFCASLSNTILSAFFTTNLLSTATFLLRSEKVVSCGTVPSFAGRTTDKLLGQRRTEDKENRGYVQVCAMLYRTLGSTCQERRLDGPCLGSNVYASRLLALVQPPGRYHYADAIKVRNFPIGTACAGSQRRRPVLAQLLPHNGEGRRPGVASRTAAFCPAPSLKSQTKHVRWQ